MMSGITRRAFSARGDAEPVSGIDEGHRTAILCHLGNIAATVRRRIAFDTKSQTIRNDAEADGLSRRAGREPWQLPDL